MLTNEKGAIGCRAKRVWRRFSWVSFPYISGSEQIHYYAACTIPIVWPINIIARRIFFTFISPHFQKLVKYSFIFWTIYVEQHSSLLCNVQELSILFRFLYFRLFFLVRHFFLFWVSISVENSKIYLHSVRGFFNCYQQLRNVIIIIFF